MKGKPRSREEKMKRIAELLELFTAEELMALMAVWSVAGNVNPDGSPVTSDAMSEESRTRPAPARQGA